MFKGLIRNVRTAIDKIDWRLLLFLVLVVNVKLVVKIAAIIFIFLVHPAFKYVWKKRFAAVHLFYVSMILIGVINALIHGLITDPVYDVVLLAGTMFWMLCMLSSTQVRLFAEQNAIKVEKTILVFILVNAAVSFTQLLMIMIDAGSLNPYNYQGEYQKYFISTGDYIKGLSFDTSTTNAAINAMAMIYFLGRKNYTLVFLSMAVLLIASSNLINLLLLCSLLYYFIFKSTREQKSAIVLSAMMLVVFIAKVSPENKGYSVEVYETITGKVNHANIIAQKAKPLRETEDYLLTEEQRKEKFALLYLDSVYLTILAANDEGKKNIKLDKPPRPLLPKDDIHSAPFQHKDDTNAYRRKLIAFVDQHKVLLPVSGGWVNPMPAGKLEAIDNDVEYLQQHPVLLVAGSGTGNYSSKLAFKATGLGMAGSFPAAFVYINPGFLSNHLDTYLHFFTQKAARHSVLNTPNSVYDQLLMEYGLIGITCFVLFYLVYFFRRAKKLSYGIPLLLLFCGLLGVDYWFEQLSVVIIFELMMFSSIPKPAIQGE